MIRYKNIVMLALIFWGLVENFVVAQKLDSVFCRYVPWSMSTAFNIHPNEIIRNDASFSKYIKQKTVKDEAIIKQLYGINLFTSPIDTIDNELSIDARVVLIFYWNYNKPDTVIIDRRHNLFVRRNIVLSPNYQLIEWINEVMYQKSW